MNKCKSPAGYAAFFSSQRTRLPVISRFPFKVLSLDGSLTDQQQSGERLRRCDLGFLRQGYETDDGAIGWRCPAEPSAAYVRKGGEVTDTVGRKCLCNALLANVGLGQVHNGRIEQPLYTCGDEVSSIHRFLPSVNSTSYSAADVIDHLLVGINSHSVSVL